MAGRVDDVVAIVARAAAAVADMGEQLLGRSTPGILLMAAVDEIGERLHRRASGLSRRTVRQTS